MKGRTTSAPKKVEKAAAAKSANTSTDAVTETATSAAAKAKPAPSHDQISLRAYELYLARGSEPGHEAEDCLTAEAELSN